MLLLYYHLILKGCRVAGWDIKIYRFIVQKFMNKKLLYGLRLKTMCQPATRQPFKNNINLYQLANQLVFHNAH